MTSLVPAREAASQREPIFLTATLDLPNPLVFSNAASLGDAAFRRWLLNSNMARRVTAPEVVLAKYESGTLLDVDCGYAVLVGDALVREQWVPGGGAAPASVLATIRQRAIHATPVDIPCLLVARYGESTWGHWLIEMLAKAVIAEWAWPGRFVYAVPAVITTPTAERSYATAVLESFRAFGIDETRLLRLQPGATYRFQQLFDVADLWTDGLHPTVLSSFRAILPRLPVTDPPRRVAFLRTGADSRAVFNLDQVGGYLRDAGFVLVDLTRTSFSEQAALFGHADIVVGSLGSNLAGLLFAPRRPKLITLAPGGWYDSYFVNILQRLDTLHADVRGPSTLFGDAEVRTAPHVIDVAQLSAALGRVQQTPDALFPRGVLTIDGEMMARRLDKAVITLSFGNTGNGTGLLRDGWSFPESQHTWSLGAASSLSLAELAVPPGDYWLDIEAFGHAVPPYLPSRPLAVFVNDHRVGAFDLVAYFRAQCYVPRACFTTDSQFTVRFEHPVCPSPRMMGGGEDTRPLGLGLLRLALHRIG